MVLVTIRGITRVDLRSPDTRDVANGRGPQTFAQPPVVRFVSTGSGAHGFDWGDAGIGAAMTAGIFLLGGAAALVIRRRRELVHLHR